jgi:hypothetical protein
VSGQILGFRHSHVGLNLAEMKGFAGRDAQVENPPTPAPLAGPTRDLLGYHIRTVAVDIAENLVVDRASADAVAALVAMDAYE